MSVQYHTKPRRMEEEEEEEAAAVVFEAYPLPSAAARSAANGATTIEGTLGSSPL